MPKYLTANILTKVLQKCSLSSPLPNISFLPNPLNLIGCLATERLNLQKEKKISSVAIMGDEAETLQNCSLH